MLLFDKVNASLRFLLSFLFGFFPIIILGQLYEEELNDFSINGEGRLKILDPISNLWVDLSY